MGEGGEGGIVKVKAIACKNDVYLPMSGQRLQLLVKAMSSPANGETMLSHQIKSLRSNVGAEVGLMSGLKLAQCWSKVGVLAGLSHFPVL